MGFKAREKEYLYLVRDWEVEGTRSPMSRAGVGGRERLCLEWEWVVEKKITCVWSGSWL